jgi:hypothetical protein
VQLTPTGSRGFNPAFDVTPARLVSALITERGVAPASEAGLRELYAADSKSCHVSSSLSMNPSGSRTENAHAQKKPAGAMDGPGGRKESGGDRNRTTAFSLGKSKGRVQVRREMRRDFG